MYRLFISIILIVIGTQVKAQKIEKIFVNLYTDSVKKGTYNYINIDGLLTNGRYIPLDSTQIIFSTSAGNFVGNNLLLPNDYKGKSVHIKATLKNNTTISDEFEVFIKQMPDGPLKKLEEVMKPNNK